MSRWRIAVVAVLILGPFLILAGIGSWYLWQTGWSAIVWLGFIAAMSVGYVLAWHWQRSQKLLQPVDFTPPEIATERDRGAWAIVQRHAEEASKFSAEQLATPEHYLEQSRALAQEMAEFYYPNVPDPIAALTVPEILTVIELATHDLNEMVEKYLPGGHLLTVRDWKRAKSVGEWYQRVSKVWWAVSAVINPLNTAIRYTATKLGLSTPLKALQGNLLVWFYTAYLQRLGTYLIELYSGRLRVGAQRWRELVLREKPDAGQEPAGPAEVTFAVLGQVKAGKSSLINALLGDQQARVDALPTTNLVSRYRLEPPGGGSAMILLDTPGYGHSGPREDQLQATLEAAKQSDLLLLVLHARNPARQADVNLMKQLREYFAAHPDLRMPPVIAVLTHIDLLTPAMEWQPPYDWQNPRRKKEEAIREAVNVAQEQLDGLIDAAVPVRTDAGKIFGIEENLLPVLAARLGQAEAVSVLRVLKTESEAGRVQRVFSQLATAGKQLLQATWESMPRKQAGGSPPPAPEGPVVKN